MKTEFMCPCGDELKADSEDALVELARHHLAAKHPDKNYSREEILIFADEA